MYMRMFWCAPLMRRASGFIFYDKPCTLRELKSNPVVAVRGVGGSVFENRVVRLHYHSLDPLMILFIYL